MTQQLDPLQYIARVRSVDGETNVVYFELQNGAVLAHVPDDEETYSPGEVVLIGPRWHQVEPAPADLWPEEPWIGTVRVLLADEVVVDIGGKPRVLPRPSGLELQQGNTVEGFDSQGIVRVLSPHPIPQLEITFRDTIDVDLFKSKPVASASFDDFGGYEEIKVRARELIELPLQHHDALLKINARPVKGVLFTGESGTGKTMLARIIAANAGAVFYDIRGPEIVSKYVGQSEEIIRRIFDDAKEQERAIIFFDEIDAIAPQRADDSHEASRRLVGQLLTLMDGFSNEANVVVIAATNRPQDIDLALKRPGRFDWQIHFPLPSQGDREAILSASSRSLKVGDTLRHELIAESTESWSGAELAAIWTEAALLAVQDGREVILAEDYLGGFERVASYRTVANAGRRTQGREMPK